ncbi:MAG: hypothetical protein HC887_01160 [Desulfobacteraceae bacterium]|nr:hypothetical protein [Desulfobacteraceae bacterium]
MLILWHREQVLFLIQFWSNIFNGKDVKTAFGNAANSLGILGDLQHPQSDANGDGLDDGNSDALAGVYIGSGSAISGENPLISEISQPQSINGTDTAKIAATITDIDGIARVWAMIRPPSYTNETQTIIKNRPDSRTSLYRTEISGQ